MSLLINSTAPDFEQDSQLGRIRFYDYLGNGWGVLFSHPADFTPVCTTELGRAANLKSEFAKRNVKMIALSVDSAERHAGWIPDIEETQSCKIDYPILADEDRSVARLYQMLPEGAPDSFTVRSVYIVDPNKKIRAMITYPASTGRNFDEILRVIDSLQLTDTHKVATPVDWKQGQDVVIVPSLQDPEEIARRFPKGYRAIRPYLRMTPQPDQG